MQKQKTTLYIICSSILCTQMFAIINYTAFVLKYIYWNVVPIYVCVCVCVCACVRACMYEIHFTYNSQQENVQKLTANKCHKQPVKQLWTTVTDSNVKNQRCVCKWCCLHPHAVQHCRAFSMTTDMGTAAENDCFLRGRESVWTEQNKKRAKHAMCYIEHSHTTFSDYAGAKQAVLKKFKKSTTKIKVTHTFKKNLSFLKTCFSQLIVVRNWNENVKLNQGFYSKMLPSFYNILIFQSWFHK